MSKDYSNTSIYKICCKDPGIKDVYVGHTKCFEQRKMQHEAACKGKTTNYKVYQFIRENGGWNNWEMIELAKYNCNNVDEAREKEQQHYIELNASLDSVPPLSKMVAIDEKQTLENTPWRFFCGECEYGCHRKSCWDQHLRTAKHLAATTFNGMPHVVNKELVCKCGKQYTDRTGLWRHKKVCLGEGVEEKCEEKVELKSSKVEVSEELLLMLIKQNSEMIEMLKGTAVTNKTTNLVT